VNKATFTVIGFYEESGEIYSEYVEARDGTDAMRVVAESMKGKDALNLVVAICGKLRQDVEGDDIARAFGTATYAGESITDTETYLSIFIDMFDNEEEKP
jgi:hypothetical protein